jgi:UDP-N-acetylmuramate dehydrogenase
MKISENISLGELNSFGVEARAARLVEWEAAEELAELFTGRLAAGSWMALGGGNNILFTRDYQGTLVRSAARDITITGESGGNDKNGEAAGQVFVRAEAGVDWDGFVAWCVERGLWGAENLSGIPGTVGACPIQNIGAYGAEAKDIIRSVEYFDVEGAAAGKYGKEDKESSIKTIAAADCAFGYRDSIFKHELRGRVIITAVNFALSKTPRPNLGYAALTEKVAKLDKAAGGDGAGGNVAGGDESRAMLENIRQAVIDIRNSKLPDPHTTGNAGSFFKNPVVEAAVAGKLAAEYPDMPLYPAPEPGKKKLAAGWLIEQAGWKGRSIGRVGIHPRQALIVVNLGGAMGAEIVDFARRVQADVKAKFGVELTPEVNII